VACCCSGTVSWFCCYPQTCTTCHNLGDTCCCQGSNCSGGCSSSSYCGVGGCCTCNSNNWGFAWENSGNPTCGITFNCGDAAYFGVNSGTLYSAVRYDTGPAPGLNRMADLTPALFTKFAPLSQGLISGMRVLKGACAWC
jgi:hypothetical protein